VFGGLEQPVLNRWLLVLGSIPDDSKAIEISLYLIVIEEAQTKIKD